MKRYQGQHNLKQTVNPNVVQLHLYNTGRLRHCKDYLNETCYLITVEFEDDSGFKYHSIIIPIDSFNKDDLKFTDNATVYLFEANNRQFVVDSAFNSQVVL